MMRDKKHLRTTLQGFLLFASFWAAQKSLRSLHALGQNVWGLIIEAFIAGALFALITYFSPRPPES